MPQYASRLARPAGQSAARPNPAVARQGPRREPGQGSGTIYENGPINGNTDAWTINFGFVVSDSFTHRKYWRDCHWNDIRSLVISR